MAVLLPPSTFAAVSVDIVVAKGDVETLVLLGSGEIFVEVKNSAGDYLLSGIVSNAAPVQQLLGPLTYRARREEVAVPWAPLNGPVNVPAAVGLDREF